MQAQQSQGSTRGHGTAATAPSAPKTPRPGRRRRRDRRAAPRRRTEAAAPSALTPALPMCAERLDRRRAQLLHRKLRDPAVPAADLPGGRRRLRDPMAGARGDQRGRDRLRPRPVGLQRRRRGMDAVPARRRGPSTASTRTATATRTPTTRPTRSSPQLATCGPPGGEANIRGAVFSYNHSQAYVSSVMLRAQLLGGTPSELLGAITGLTEARFPVYAAAHFADGFPSVRTRKGGSEDARRHRDLRAGRRAGDRLPGRGSRAARRLPHAGALRAPPRRVRQPVHLRAARHRPARLPGDRAARRLEGQRAVPGAAANRRPTGPATAGEQPRSPVTEGAAVSGLALGAAASLESAPAQPSASARRPRRPPAPPRRRPSRRTCKRSAKAPTRSTSTPCGLASR